MNPENLTFNEEKCKGCMLEDFCNGKDADGCRAFIKSTIYNIETSRRSDDDDERVSSYNKSVMELLKQAKKQGLEIS